MSVGSELGIRRVAKDKRAAVFFSAVFLFLICPAMRAQENELSASPDLTQENLSRVAAAPEQIQAVLQKDPGLMVELKRWVAREATNGGQVLSDSDLTDQAIFERLNGDVEFRAVATRLVQRYGYLLPRTKADAAKGQTSVVGDSGGEISCDPAFDPDCTPQEGRLPSPKTGQPHTTPLPEATVPDQLASPGSAGSPSLTEGGIEAGGSSQLALQPLAETETNRVNALELREMHSAPGPAARPAATAGNQGSGTSEHATIVHRPNPYADVPSLYDLYTQVSAHVPATKRFGLDIFRNGNQPSDLLPMDLPVGPDYVVGPGDGLTIDLWGGVSQRLYRTIDHEGRLALPEVGPVLVSGRTLGEVQQAVQQILRTQFRDVSADVSLKRLRTVRVYVVGDVERPGAYDISSLSTPLNALFYGGGPTARGSLRILSHYRGKQLVQDVDVYDLLLRGLKSDLQRLENGDTVLVPPIGPQITIEGMVRRPSTYELRKEKSLAEALELAGGILPSAALRHIEVQRLVAHEKRTMLSLDIPDVQDAESVRKQLESFAIQDGDQVRIFPIAPYNQAAVYLEGHVLRPGRYSYHAGMRLTDLVSSYKDLLPEPAAQYAEIIRLNAPDYRPSVENFDLAAALASPASAPMLQPLDTVRIFGRYDFEDVPTVSVLGDVRRPGTYRMSGQIHLSDAIRMAGGLTPDALLESAQVFQYQPDSKLKAVNINLTEALAGNPMENLLLRPRDRIVVHRNPAKADPAVVSIQGEVLKPGRYPLTTNLTTGDLIRLAGGLRRSADTDTADLTRYWVGGKKQPFGRHQEIQIAAALAGDPAHSVVMLDGDVLTIRQRPRWSDIGASVVIRGEVAHPGVYGIAPGERLSSVLQRAGGFLPTAYPQAAVLQRTDVRQLQQKSRDELIEHIQLDALSIKTAASAGAGEQATTLQASLLQHEQAIAALRQAPITGRLVVRLRSDVSSFANSPDDIELRSGDSLVIPKRPDFVVVTGQVYSSNAITCRPHKNAGWYLQQAGGPTDLANKKAIFIVRASGSVVSNKGEWWNGNVLSTLIEPGDSIVVPEKAIGGSTAWKNLLDVAQIAQAGAISAFVLTR